MQIYYKLSQPTEKMARITRAELCEKLDETLETINKKDIGMVISDPGKRDLVICPAYWFDFYFDDDFGCIINSAVRYAIGRDTYMPSTVANFVRKYMDVLDKKTTGVLLKDLNEALANESLCQYQVWHSLREDLLAFLKDAP